MSSHYPLLSPKLDIVFKRLFVAAPDLLCDLLSLILVVQGLPTMRHLDIRNPEIPPEAVHGKLVQLDILAEDEQGRLWNVEMQMQGFRAYPERSIFYLAKLYVGALERGEPYAALKPALGVHLLGYRLFPRAAQGLHCFEWRERHNPELRLTDQLKLFVLELPKLESAAPAEPLAEWLHFFQHAHTLEDPMNDPYTHPPVQKAAEKLRELSADEKERIRAWEREKALHDWASYISDARQEGHELGRAEGRAEGLAEGRAEGIEQGVEQGRQQGLEAGIGQGREEARLAIARRALSSMDDAAIAQLTGLTEAVVRALRASESGTGSH